MGGETALKCHWCGRFVGGDVTWDMPWAGDWCIRNESPEPVPCCPKCAAHE